MKSHAISNRDAQANKRRDRKNEKKRMSREEIAYAIAQMRERLDASDRVLEAVKKAVDIEPSWPAMWKLYACSYFLGFTGMQHYLRSDYSLAIAFSSTFGLFGFGWMFDLVFLTLQRRVNPSIVWRFMRVVYSVLHFGIFMVYVETAFFNTDSYSKKRLVKLVAALLSLYITDNIGPQTVVAGVGLIVASRAATLVEHLTGERFVELDAFRHLFERRLNLGPFIAALWLMHRFVFNSRARFAFPFVTMMLTMVTFVISAQIYGPVFARHHQEIFVVKVLMY